MTLLFYHTGFINTLWSSILIILLNYLVSDNIIIRKSKEEKVLGITFDNKFDFSTHLTSITKKANVNLNTLNTKIIPRIQKYITPEQKTFLTSSFIKAQLNYCPLILIFVQRKLFVD